MCINLFHLYIHCQLQQKFSHNFHFRVDVRYSVWKRTTKALLHKLQWHCWHGSNIAISRHNLGKSPLFSSTATCWPPQQISRRFVGALCTLPLEWESYLQPGLHNNHRLLPEKGTRNDKAISKWKKKAKKKANQETKKIKINKIELCCFAACIIENGSRIKRCGFQAKFHILDCANMGEEVFCACPQL